MKKINMINLILLFFMISPLLDASIVLIKLPISTLVRGFLFLISIIYLIKNKYNLKETFILLLFMIIIGIHFYFIDYSIFNIISMVIKLFYFPFMILLFNNLDYDKNIKKTIIITLLIYIGIYLLSYIFNIGYNNYKPEEGKIGYRGLFNSINELSAILVMLYYYSYKFLLNKKTILIIISFLMLIISYLTGTKVLLGGVLIIILINEIPKLYNYFKNANKNNKIIIIISSILVIITSMYLFTLTNTYHNMQVQGDFFKVNNIFSYEYLNKVIFNDRLSFLNTNYNIFIKTSFINILLGLNINKYPKLVEIDIFDITFIYGIIGLILIIYIMYLIIKNLKNKDNFIPFIILILISLTSGHVLISPAVSIYFGLIMYLKDSENL